MIGEATGLRPGFVDHRRRQNHVDIGNVLVGLEIASVLLVGQVKLTTEPPLLPWLRL